MDGQQTVFGKVESGIARTCELLAQLDEIAEAFGASDMPAPSEMNDVLERLVELDLDTMGASWQSLLCGVRG